METSTHLFLGIILLFGSILQSFCQELESNGNIYRFEGADAPSGECQVCIEYFRQQDVSLGGVFRQGYKSFFELDENWDECCDGGGSSCQYDIGCNHHTVEEVQPIFTQVNQTSNSSVNPFTMVFSAGLASLLGQTSSCTPPGSSSNLCANFVFTNRLIVEDSNVIIAGNISLPVKKDSVLITMTISQWLFDSASKGLKMRLQIGGMLLRITEFNMEPGDVQTATPPVAQESGTFTGVQMMSDDGREGQITFSPVAVLDGSDVPTIANVTGLYPHEYDPYSRYVDIVVPKFNSMVQYSFNIFIPEGSSADDDSGNSAGGANSFFENTLGVSLTFALIGAAVVVFCVLITIILLRRRRHTGTKQRVKR